MYTTLSLHVFSSILCEPSSDFQRIWGGGNKGSVPSLSGPKVNVRLSIHICNRWPCLSLRTGSRLRGANLSVGRQRGAKRGGRGACTHVSEFLMSASKFWTQSADWWILITVEPVYNGPALSGHPLLSGQFSKSRFCAHTNAIFVTCIRRPPLLSGLGHPVAVLCLSFFVIFTCSKRPPLNGN